MASDQIVEFQIEVTKVADLVRHRLLEEEFCTDPFIDGSDGQPVIIDHISFSGEAQLRFDPDPAHTLPVPIKLLGTVTVSPVQLLIPVTVFIKSLSCISDPQCGAEEYKYSTNVVGSINPFVYLVFTLTANGAKISAQFASLESWTDEPVNLPPDFMPGVKNAILSRAIPLDALTPLLDSLPPVTNSALSANADLDRLALRMEFLGEDSMPLPLETWSAFCQGQVGAGLSDRSWSVYIGGSLLENALKQKFSKSTKKSAQFTLAGDPQVTWYGFTSYGGGAASVMFQGQVDVDGCPNSIGVDPATVWIEFSVDGNMPNVIQSHATLYTDLVDSDVFECSIVYGAGAWAVNWVLGIIVTVAINIAAGSVEPSEEDLDLPPQCTPISGTEFKCKTDVKLPSFNFSKDQLPFRPAAKFTLDKMIALPGGPIIGGPCDVPAVADTIPIKVSSSGFTFGLNGSCGTSGWVGYACKVDIKGGGIICGDGIEIIHDPLNMFGVVPKKPKLWYAGTVQVLFPSSGDIWDPTSLDAYFVNPYPCMLKIRTSRGSQCFQIAPPNKPTGTPDDWTKQLFVYSITCLKYQITKFVPIWFGDPPWEIPVEVELEGQQGAITAALAINKLEITFFEHRGRPIVPQREGLQSSIPARLILHATVETRETHSPLMIDLTVPISFSGRLMKNKSRRIEVTAERLVHRVDVVRTRLPRGITMLSFHLRLDFNKLLWRAANISNSDPDPVESGHSQHSPAEGESEPRRKS